MVAIPLVAGFAVGVQNHNDTRESRHTAQNTVEREKVRGGRGEKGAQRVLPALSSHEVLGGHPGSQVQREDHTEAYLRRS